MSDEITMEEFEARERTLRERYPYQFSPHREPEIPYGWIGVLEAMCSHLNAILPDRLKKHFKFRQLKEKFGSGRFYFEWQATQEAPDLERHLDVDLHQLIEIYEDIAGHTCAVCGKPARRVRNGWVKALCEEHEVD